MVISIGASLWYCTQCLNIYYECECLCQSRELNLNIAFWVKYETSFFEGTWAILLTLGCFDNCYLFVIALLVIVALSRIDQHRSIWLLSCMCTDEFSWVSMMHWDMMYKMRLRSLCYCITYVGWVCCLRINNNFKLRVLMCRQNMIFFML